MLCLLSPAKAMREVARLQAPKGSAAPVMAAQTAVLLEELKQQSAAQLSKLMSISDALGKLNHGRYQQWEDATEYVAIDLFDGEAFKALDVDSFSAEDRAQMQKSLVVLSGLYGMIRPDDAIRPYRLEMGTKFAIDGAKNLVNFWHQHGLTDALAEHAKSVGAKIILNCASDEYAKAIDFAKLERDYKLQVLRFKGVKPGGARGLPGVFSKQARGMMSRYVIQSKASSVEDLEGFSGTEGRYKFLRRDGNELLFERHDKPQTAAAEATASKTQKTKKKDAKADSQKNGPKKSKKARDTAEAAVKAEEEDVEMKETASKKAKPKAAKTKKDEKTGGDAADPDMQAPAAKVRRVQPSRRARSKLG